MGRLEAFLRSARKRVQAGAYAPAGDALDATHDFAPACAQGAIVAEVKPASPSEGPLLQDPRATITSLAAERPDALSVLTDADHFAGDPLLLRHAHATGVPVLMKDFVVDEAQLDAACHHGAAAVLLIERALTPAERDRLVQAAHDRGLQVLLEVHDATESEAARASDADVLGVNARDLNTLAMDASAAHAVLKLLRDDPRPVLHLSGVQDRRDRRDAMAAGADAVLVGSTLCRGPDPGLALRALRRPLAKVCGLTHADDVQDAVQAGADLLGFIHAPGSPRHVAMDDAVRLAGGPTSGPRTGGARRVLVTTGAALQHEFASFDWVQSTALPDAPEVVQAFLAHGTGWMRVVAPGASARHAHGIVADTPSRQGGGTGRTHDWAASARSVVAHRGRLSLVAGGLDADNAADALAATGAWGADAASRLEARPGRKDPGAVAAFVRAVHAAEAPA